MRRSFIILIIGCGIIIIALVWLLMADYQEKESLKTLIAESTRDEIYGTMTDLWNDYQANEEFLRDSCSLTSGCISIITRKCYELFAVGFIKGSRIVEVKEETVWRYDTQKKYYMITLDSEEVVYFLIRFKDTDDAYLEECWDGDFKKAYYITVDD